MKTQLWLALFLCAASLLWFPSCLTAGENEKSLVQPYYVSPRSGSQHVSLDGDWELGYRDAPVESPLDLTQQQRWIHAQVPSSVQWALYEAGELPHPYHHLNSKKYTWVPDKVWYYRRSFLSPSAGQGRYVFLCFDGAGYYLRIWLNGTLLGRHEGMFGGPQVEISGFLRPAGPNELIVEVKAGSYGVENWDPLNGKVVMPWNIAGGTPDVTGASGISTKEFLPLGLWRSVRLEVVPKTHLERPFLVTKEATAQEARLALSVEVLVNARCVGLQLHPWEGGGIILHGFRDSWTAKPFQGSLDLEVTLYDKGSSHEVLMQSFPLQTYEGRNWFQHELRITSPNLWWPVGLGKPNLYRVKLSLVSGGEPIDNLEFDYGIRTIRNLPSAGPRTQDRWANWQFVVNDRPLFVKGINLGWPFDVLLHLPPQRYRWMLEAAHQAGIQLIRVSGEGNPETEEFYSLCDQLGIMVWQGFTIGNRDTLLWPQDVWEAQVLQIIFSLRNHPSLAVWSGGNEFNPYSLGNAATTGITERSVADFDGSRLFVRATPDPGNLHIYEDLDPTWFGHEYRFVPFVSETGLFNMPEPQAVLEVVDARELETPLHDIFSKQYAASHPEFIHHLPEYQSREPRTMWSRATQIDDLSSPNLATFSEASQVASGEWSQIVSDLVQANYPATTGLMPWSLTVPWPMEFFMFLDWFGEATPSYYFLKRTYEPTHVLVRLPQLIWAKGEKLPITISVVQAPANRVGGLRASVEVLDQHFERLWRQERPLAITAGPSVTNLELGGFTIPDSLEDKFFFLLAELKEGDGRVLSRSVYWPRCLKLMEDAGFRNKYRESPQPSLVFDRGPWLRQQVKSSPDRTSLELELLSSEEVEQNWSRLKVRARNTGLKPAFLTQIDVEGTKRASYGTDNFFWLAPKEERVLVFDVLWRDSQTRDQAILTIGAWNAATQKVSLRLGSRASFFNEAQPTVRQSRNQNDFSVFSVPQEAQYREHGGSQ